MTQHDARQSHNAPPEPRSSPARKTPTPPRAPTPRRPDRREQRSITLSTGPVEYTLRLSGRATRVRLVIQPGGALEVVAPHGATQTRVESALREHETWIARTRARLSKLVSNAAPEPLTQGRSLALAGRTLRLNLRLGAPEGRFRVSMTADDQLTLTLPSQDDALVHAALEAFYRRQARTIITERLNHWNAHYGYTWTRVTIKEQKTRWGSCSRKGSLNFNWRLLLAPLPVLDYVVVHELCHLCEMSHAPRFWRLVEIACPDYVQHRRWLRAHGQELAL